jgi:hypothetical protein
MSWQLLQSRTACIKKYLNGDLEEKLLTTLERLTPNGMNYPITDSESPDRAVQPCVHWWLAPELTVILNELDALSKRAKAQRLIARKGNRSLPQTNNVKEILDSRPTRSLPINWYRPEWYKGLNTFQKVDLRSRKADELVDIVNVFERFPYSLAPNPVLF